MSKVQIRKIVYLFIFVILIFPRSFQQFIPSIHYLINILKGISILFLTFYFIKTKQKLSLFSKCVFFYFGYLFLMTILNHESIINFLKSYYFNYGIIIFGELVFKDKEKDFYIEKLADIFLILNIANLVCMVICKIVYGVYYFGEFYNTFLLDSDNRFILYIIPPILAYNYLYGKENNKGTLYKLITLYMVGLLSLFLSWSAAALMITCLLFFGNIFILYMQKKSFRVEFPIKVFISLIFLLNIGIVFFRIQNVFEFLIVDILHKSLHLSYRTYIWDIAINFFRSDFIRLIFGHGFLNTSELFTFTAINGLGQEIVLSPNHLHNLLINTLYFGGIIGTFIYAYFFYIIVKKVDAIKNNICIKNVLTIVFGSLNLLLIFDSYEMYSIYYLILLMIYSMSTILIEEESVEQKNSDLIREGAKMKIVIIDEGIDRIGGVERTINTLANRLIKSYSVDIFSENKTSQEPYYTYNPKVKRIYFWDDTISRAKKRKKKDFFYYLLRFPEKVKAQKTKTKKIRKIVENDLTTADVILFGRMHIALHYLKYFDKNKIKAKVVVRDAIFLDYYPKSIIRKIKKYYSQFVDILIVSSDESKKNYEVFFEKTNSRIEIIKIYNPLGIKPHTGYDFSKKSIISMGRIEMQKGYDALVAAFKIVHSKHPDWKLEIYGDGSYKKEIKRLIKRENLEKSVFLKPSTKNVVEVFNRSSIFVMSSRYEGYANVLVEALACGIPSISYDWLMGVDEIIKDGVNGKIVSLKNRKDYMYGKNDPEDIRNLANCINYLIENKDVCDKMIKNSILIQESRNPEKIMQEWQNIILKEKK